MIGWRYATAVALLIALMPTSVALAFESSKLSPGVVTEGSGMQSPKLSPGVVTEGSGLQSPKLSPGVIIEGNGLQSSKLSVGIVVANTAAFESAKLSVGVVVETLSSSGGVVPRAPLTHW